MPSLAKPSTRLRLAILFALPVAFSVVIFLVNTAAERNASRMLELQRLSAGIDKLRSVANDAEIGEHGFLLTGDEQYLLTLRSANAKVNSYIKQIPPADATLTPGMPGKLDHVIYLVRERLDQANHVVSIQRSQGFPAALALSKSGSSRGVLQQVNQGAEQLRNEVNRQLGRQSEKQKFLTRFAFLLFVFGTLIMLAVLTWLYNSLLSHLQGRDQAHAQLKELNTDLERRITERTKELQEFNDELQQFAYVASHDLQEPLRTITSFTQLLAARYKGRLDEDADEFIGYIVTSSRRMTDLINGLLALVRVRKPRQGVTPVPFDELLEEAQMTLQASIRESGAQIQSDALPSLIVDRVQFLQVFQNLISNAIKYRREESPRILVRGIKETSAWIISFADNGCGFDQQFAERIFGLFQRLQSREIEGTGMGLSIARKIVERHGGRIWAESVEGVGSTLYLSLPVSLEPRLPSKLQTSGMAEAPAEKR